MNERIKELAEQAEDDVVADHRGDAFHKAFTEKFAELIVKECAATASNWVMDTDGSDMGVARAVKQHFGVE